MVDVGDVREGVSDPAPGAESIDRGAGEPSASPLLIESGSVRGDFIDAGFDWATTRGAGLLMKHKKISRVV